MKLSKNKASKLAYQSIYFSDLIDQAYSHLPTALFASILLSALLVAVLWGEVTDQILLIWISVLWAITIARFVQFFRYRSRKDASVKNWAYRFCIGVILSGVVWGSSGIFIFPESSLLHQVFLAFVLGGLIAGSTTSLSPVQWIFRVFVFLLIIPMVLRFILMGGEVYLTMGGMLAIYGALCIVMSSRIYTTLVTSIHLQYKNKEEIEERKKAEDSLKRAHDQLEAKVQERTKELRKALDEVKTLRGILPICSHCKKIRNDEGNYVQIETYLRKTSEVNFTHTICPTCMKKHYPKEYQDILSEDKSEKK